ncbi:MAG: trigger factor [Candidatus Kuenenia sp.]|nr:trigger factor [Candidatus Kuenenia hertensis]
MNLTIEDAGPCKKLLKFEIPKETIESEFEKKTQEACSAVQLPGFRKGRAPRKLVEKRFETQIKEDVKQTIISESYEKALEENKIEPVGDPKFDPDFGNLNIEIGKPLAFDVTLEVLPIFEVNEYKGIPLKKKAIDVLDEEIEKTLKELALQKAQLSVIDSGGIEERDVIICDCKIDVDSITIFEDNDVEIKVLDESKIANTAIPDLAGKLKGKTTGKSCVIDVILSNDFTIREYCGKKAKINLVVNEIKRLIPPEIDENFAKTLNSKSLDDLKINVRKRLEANKNIWAENDLRKQILDTLLAQTQFDLPKDFVDRHTEERLYKHQLDLVKRGVPFEEVQKQTEAIKNASEESVMKELKASLILDHIAKKEKIFVTENEVDQRIAEIAYSYNTDKKIVRKQLETHGNLSYLRNEMREDKALAFLIKEAKIEEEAKK